MNYANILFHNITSKKQLSSLRLIYAEGIYENNSYIARKDEQENREETKWCGEGEKGQRFK